jgi:dCTP deaminase
MRLNDIDIIKRLTGDKKLTGGKDPIVITPMICASEQIGPSSVDVHLGNRFMVVAHSDRQNYDPLMTREEYQEWLKHLKVVNRYAAFSEPFVLHPWQFTLALTLEFISLPNDIVGRIDGRSSWARQGLVVHSTAGDIHPGTSGFVVFELLNYGPVPILLYPGLAIAQLTFEELSGKSRERYAGKYSGFRRNLWSRYQDDMILSAMRRLRAAGPAGTAQYGTEVPGPKVPSKPGDTSVKHKFVATRGREAQYLKEGLPTATGAATSEFEAARRYFNTYRDQILEQYEGQYVAILNDEIVDYDSNWEELSERTYRSFGDRNLFMPFASRKEKGHKIVSRPKRRKDG